MSNGVEVLVKDKSGEGKHEQTKYMEVKTIQPTAPSNMYASNYAKIDKRIDSSEDGGTFELIQPSEVSHTPCTTTSCSCSHTQTEGLKSKPTNIDVTPTKYGVATKYGSVKFDLKPTNKEDKKTQYSPYEFESTTLLAPVDKVVEKYTEVMNEYSDEKDSNSAEETELLTNEQAPPPPKPTKVANKTPEKSKPEKPQKTNKNKFVVADLLKLGSLGIKGLSQLAPVFEKMTGSFIKRQDTVAEKTTTTSEKPTEKVIAYNANKRVDSDFESKQGTFPIYIPVDEMEMSESQTIYTNATLHQNLVWANEHKQSKSHHPHKIIHESPLVNGGIPISPGEIITTNSDVIVGKPAVGGPLTLAASGIKLHNPVNPPKLDSLVAANEHYLINERPSNDQAYSETKVDDSYDLRPPELPKYKSSRPLMSTRPHMNDQFSKYPYRMPNAPSEDDHKPGLTKPPSPVLLNHGKPSFIDYIHSFGSLSNIKPTKHHVDFRPPKDNKKEIDIEDNSPSSSEIVSTHIRTDEDFSITGDTEAQKPFLVDIQPSRVANVIIPHGSSTALVFAGSSEPHKTGDYVDDPLPYPEPGYFGSFSIDAPQMTNVHNVAPNNNKPTVGKQNQSPLDNYKPNTSTQYKEHSYRNDLKLKWNDNKRPDFSELPPPTSNQETHVQVGPQITAYDPNIYQPNNGDFDKYNQVKANTQEKYKSKEVIDREYENFLAVPPPPPKMHFNQDSVYGKNKPYSQRPIIQHKPVQDMKVFLNIQHPVPKEQLPPKVTSEIYFAAQGPSNKPSPTYSIQMPPTQSQYNKFNTHLVNNVYPPKTTSVSSGPSYNTFPILSSHNVVNKSILAHDKDNEGSYTVTLNTATNVASNANEIGQVIGSSLPVPLETTVNSGQINANIPIGTNFAIRVEDNTSSLDTYHSQGNQNTQIIYDEHRQVPFEVSIGDNRWNKSTTDNENTIIGHNYFSQSNEIPINVSPVRPLLTSLPTLSSFTTRPSIPPSVNSHANFPMLNEYNHNVHFNIPPQTFQDVKPVTQNVIDSKNNNDQKRPGKHIPNLPTNSHGWYSSVVLDENNVKNIAIKTESTTRRIIPLHEYSDNYKPSFGQKITSAGKPPSEFWSQKKPLTISDFNVGKPFSASKPGFTKTSTYSPPFVVKPHNKHNYLPATFGTVQQPAYDIPVRDNSDETTTVKIFGLNTENIKPVYENAEEIYDGEDEKISENDGEISSESMKIPVVSASSEVKQTTKGSTELTLLQDEVIDITSSPNIPKTTPKPVVENNTGTQTEKPFNSNNRTSNFQTNAIKPIYNNNPYMKPRPFTMGTLPVLDHQLQQPHWQINQLLVNSTNVSYEDNLDLNIGEEMMQSTAKTPLPSSSQRVPTYGRPETEIKYKNPPRPVYHSRFNKTKIFNDTNIITSTVHINDKKPLVVEKLPEETTLPTFTITADTVELNRSSSEIIDLSPPPPTVDYSFKPSTNDEMIMGMSPPPPRNPPGMRLPPRIPLTPRPALPPRTPSPYRTKPPKTLPPRLPQRPSKKPINGDEIFTYRPAYDIVSSNRRPTYNRDQPSSQLLPPPREMPSKAVSSVIDIPPITLSVPSATNVVFPTPISSGWLTSSGIGFSSSFNFDSSSVQLETKLTPTSVYSELPSSEDPYSYENKYSSENVDDGVSSEKPVTEIKLSESKYTSTESDIHDSASEESSQENLTTDRMKVIPIRNNNRTRKPYPFRNDDKKTNTTKPKLPPKPTATIRPTRTLTRPDVLYPTRATSIRKIIRPIPTRYPAIVPTNIIESSESSIEEEFVKPTEVLMDSVPSLSQVEATSLVQKGSVSIITPGFDESTSSVHSTHHAGNEIKISDEVIPTRTEFKTTVITLTKTLSEPPLTVSSIGYVNLTHTLTVTHTKTSLISQSEGAVTQTLVLTNTHTSTIVDVVTEIHTKVQPTTIVETVTKHIPVPQVEPTPVHETVAKTKIPLDDITMSSEEEDNLIIRDRETTENVQKIDTDAEGDNDTFFVVMNKSQSGGPAPPISTDLDTNDYDVTRNEQVNNNGVSQVLFGEILLAGTPYLETTNVHGTGYGKECQPDCKASRNERCQRIDGIMKCVCRPGFARMFPDRPCKPTYTYSVKLALGSQGNSSLHFHTNLSDNSSKQYQALAVATHEGINRMVMQSDLRDVFHGVHINGFKPVEMKELNGEAYQGVMNDFYVQLSDNAHESRLKEVIEKYLRNNNYSLGGTTVHAAGELVDRLDVSDFDECKSAQFHDCSEHAQCFNLRGTYTCSCLEGFADLSVNTLYPGRICSAEPVGCDRCNYHGSCYSRDDARVLCECFQWYAGSTCQVNLKVVLISLVVLGVILTIVLTACAVVACSKKRPRPQKRSIVACIQSMPSLHQGAIPSKQRQDRRALISERGDGADTSSVQNASLPYMPAKRPSSSSKKCVISDPPSHDPPPPPAPAVMIPRARLHAHHDSRENVARKRSLELSSEAKLISYLESGATTSNDEMRRKHSLESSYSAHNKDRHKQGALVSAGFKVSTTIRPEDAIMKEDRDDLSSVNKADLEAEMHFDSLRKSYRYEESQEDLSEWTDAERKMGELTLSEARSVGGTLPASTGRAASSTRLTHQEANTMAERDLGSTFLLPHVHLYKPDLTSDVSEFDSL